MNCPHCHAENSDGAPECPSCGLIFAKWRKVQAEQVLPSGNAQPARVWEALVCYLKSRNLFYPFLLAFAPALFFAFRFKDYLPVPEGWYSFERWLFPLAYCDLAIHEAGHVILGILGVEFLTVAGGTIFQLVFPLAFFVTFFKQESRAGMFFSLFWLGFALCDISYYCADAKLQCLILISGMSGQEGGGHDWNYLLGRIGLLDYCVGFGRLFMFSGCYTIAFAIFAPLGALFKRGGKPENFLE
ncbi:MAG: zinc ribbon domain-containing protein [Elusimicrobiaceae bacterium]